MMIGSSTRRRFLTGATSLLLLLLVIFLSLSLRSYDRISEVISLTYRPKPSDEPSPTSHYATSPTSPLAQPGSESSEQAGISIPHIATPTPDISQGSRTWTFKPEDARNYALDEEQCGIAFPNLYQEIDRAVAHRHDVGNITADDINLSWKKYGIVRAMIYDRKLYVIEAKYDGGGYDVRRSLSILSSIHRAIVAYRGPIPNIEFSFSTKDMADPDNQSRTVWALSREDSEESQWVMPDYGYWSWEMDLIGEYEELRKQIANEEISFSEKKPVAFWRGANNNDVRNSLLKVSRPYKETWADIKKVVWSSRGKLSSSSEGQMIPMADHCKLMFLVHAEGASYSGRGKYLQNCNSVVIMHKLRWIENYHHLLVPSGPDQNFVQVERDFSDLPTKMEHLLNDREKAERIAKNSVATFRDRYLTPAAQACYWRKMFWGWSSVSFAPKLYVDSRSLEDSRSPEVEDGLDLRSRLRGVPYETHLLTAFDESRRNCGWFKKLTWSC